MNYSKKLEGNARGARAEEAACQDFLRRHSGARVIGRNFLCPQGELDLVFELEWEGSGEWVFAEVRYRSRAAWVDGVESVTYPKRRRLRRTVQVFLERAAARGARPRSVRFDILSVTGEGDGVRVTHFKDIWLEE